MALELVDRRTAIVRAAFNQVATVGLGGLRLRRIAEDVGIDHSTLHHHFPGKKDIIAAVAEYAIGQFGSRLPEGPDPAESLRAYLRYVRKLLTESPEVFVVTVELDLHARRDPEIRTVMEHHEANWRQSLGELFTGDDAQDVWPPRIEAQAAVELVIAVVKGVQLTPDVAGTVFAQLDAALTK